MSCSVVYLSVLLTSIVRKAMDFTDSQLVVVSELELLDCVM